LISLFSSNFSFSQKSKKADSGSSESTMTEYDYYETLRLERKKKKVKTISSFSTFNDVIELKDYFDDDGFLRKREFYMSDMMGENIYVWKELNSIEYDSKGNMSGDEINFGIDKEIFNQIQFSNNNPIDFYDIGFGETLVDEVKYIFDSENNLLEKRSYGGHLYGTGKDYESEFFYYDSNKKLIESKAITGESSINISKYFYNENGLLIKTSNSYEFQNNGRDYGTRYEYEYYDSEYDSNTNMDNVFTEFFELFKTAILNQNKTDLETLTDWSVNNGGVFSIDVQTKSGFMKNVYGKLLNDFWINAISLAEMGKTIQSQFGQISFSKIDPVTYGYSANEDIYVLNNCGNGLVFKKINNGFKLVSMLIINEGD